MTERLFVYGTLGPGRPNEHILKDIGGEFQMAFVSGTLLNAGWGAALGYPGIILDEKADKVQGFLFSSNQLVNHWAELDNFEGEAYERVLTQVELEDKTMVKAYVYTLKTG